MTKFDSIRLRQLSKNRQVLWREHALQRMADRGINKQDVRKCLEDGVVIEDYLNDYPVPSALILGWINDDTPLHVVCSIYQDMACIITAYIPDKEHWENDMCTRKAGK